MSVHPTHFFDEVRKSYLRNLAYILTETLNDEKSRLSNNALHSTDIIIIIIIIIISLDINAVYICSCAAKFLRNAKPQNSAHKIFWPLRRRR
jgi:hypothetical protein